MATAAAAAVLAGAGAAGAATVISVPPYTLSDTSFGTGFGVHSDGTQMGNTIDAHVDIDGSAVTFSSTDTLTDNGGGEADLKGPLNNLDVMFAKSWGRITFAFELPNKTTSNMSIFINGSATPTFDVADGCTICALTSKGEQKFVLKGPSIDELRFTFTEDGIEDAKQFRVGGPVPEPATWAMMILGVAMIGFVARRRGQGAAFAA
jgi:hypothetical protein